MLNPFEKYSFSALQENKNPQEVSESELLTFESNFEKRSEIMEKAREGRLTLLKDIFASRTADTIGNLIPGIDVTKMSTEAILGKTISGKKLSNKERISYAIISGGISLAYLLELSGMSSEALTARGITSVFATLELGPPTIQMAAEKFKNKFPKISHLLEKVYEFSLRKDEIFKKVTSSVRELIGDTEQ